MFELVVDEELFLRVIHPDDTLTLFENLERNRGHLRPWIDPTALPETLKAARTFTIECYLNSLDPLSAIDTPYFEEIGRYCPGSYPPLELGVWVNGVLSGEVSMTRMQDGSAVAEFGYWLSQDQQGKGIITRCVHALTEYAITEMQIERFIIGCAAENYRSRAVAERLGYHIQATVPNGEVVGETVYDRVIYGIQAAAWRERYPINA